MRAEEGLGIFLAVAIRLFVVQQVRRRRCRRGGQRLAQAAQRPRVATTRT